MTIRQFLTDLAKKQIFVKLSGNNLSIKGHTNDLLLSEKEYLRNNKSRILAFLSKKNTSELLKKMDNTVEFPLSISQKGLWLASQSSQSDTLYNMPSAFFIHGDIDFELLNKAFQLVCSRHILLHSKITNKDNNVFWAVQDELPIIKIISQEDHTELLKNEMKKGFDLETDFPIRAMWMKKDECSSYLFVTSHHLAFDMISVRVMLEEISVAYESLLSGSEVILEDHLLQYSDYAIWQSSDAYKESITARISEYADWCRDYPAEHNLILSKERESLDCTNGMHFSHTLDKNDVAKLKSACEKEGATLFMGWHAIVSKTIADLADNDKIILGVPISNRPDERLAKSIGFFVNTLAVPHSVDRTLTLNEMIKSSKECLTKAFTYEDIPFSSLINELNPSRSTSASPVVQIIISLEDNDNSESFKFGSSEVSLLENKIDNARYDLTITARIKKDQLTVNWEYKSSIFDESLIQSFAKHLSNTLTSFVSERNNSLNKSILFTDTKKTENRKNRTVASTFCQIAKEYPNNIAVTGDTGVATYAELDSVTNKIANLLLKNNIRHGDRVAIILPRGLEWVEAALGTLKASASYVPINEDNDEHFIASVIKKSGAKFVITNLKNYQNFDCLVDSDILLMDASYKEEMLGNDISQCQVSSSPMSEAYLMFTSGTTGQPKGVSVSSLGITSLIENSNELENDHNTIMLHSSNVAFDATTFEVWTPLLKGGQLVISRSPATDIDSVSALIEKYHVNTTFFTSRVFDLWAGNSLQSITSLKNVVAGGERVSPKSVQLIYNSNPEITIYNGYGPTENTTFSTFYKIPRKTKLSHNAHLPIGKPLSGRGIAIVNSSGSVAPINGRGEIVTFGDGVALGYVGAKDCDNNKFKEHENFSGKCRTYHTGDIGYIDEDGLVNIIGRSDKEIKVRGFRVNTSQIENVIESLDTIHTACVIFNKELLELVAYVTADADISQIKTSLKTMLPDYMTPKFILKVSEIPTTINGKVNVAELCKFDKELFKANKMIEPVTDTEKLLYEIWTSILGHNNFGIEDNFLDVGGNSILMTKLLLELQAKSGKNIKLKDIFSNQTILSLAEHIDSQVQKLEKCCPKLQDYDLPQVCSGAQARMWHAEAVSGGNGQYVIAFAAKLPDSVNKEAIKGAVKSVIASHSILRTSYSMTEEGQLKQTIMSTENFITSENEVDKEQNIQDLLRNENGRCFDLSQDYPLVSQLVKVKDTGNTYLFLTVHHIAFDGWSQSVFFNSLESEYERILVDGSVKNELSGPQYIDYAVWENSDLGKTSHKEGIDYWTNKLINCPANVTFPKVKDIITDATGAIYTDIINRNITSSVKDGISDKNTTLFTMLYAALNATLYRYTQAKDIVIGSAFANRSVVGTDKMIGFFINSLPLRTHLHKDISFNQLLEQCQKTVDEARTHQSTPIFKVTEPLMKNNNLFKVMLTLQNNTAINNQFSGDDIEIIEVDKVVSENDVTLNMWESDGELVCKWIYDAQKYDTEFMTAVSNTFKSMLIELVGEGTSNTVGSVHLSSTIIGVKRDYPLLRFEEQFEKQAKKTPDALALKGSRSLTYKELSQEASRLANYLTEMGVEQNENVGVLMTRDVDVSVAFLAINKVGATYVPLDINNPDSRLIGIINSANIRVVLTNTDNKLNLLSRIDSLNVKEAKDDISTFEATFTNDIALSVNNPCYIIHTSGSTGKPKGVVTTHHNLCTYLDHVTNTLLDTVSFNSFISTSIAFDATITSLVTPLVMGGTTEFIPDGEEVSFLLSIQNITAPSLFKLTPSHVEAIRNSDIIEDTIDVPHVFVIGGEALKSETADFLLSTFPNAKVVNEYGPTEATVGCISSLLNKKHLRLYSTSEIGHPHANTAVEVVSPEGGRQPLFAKGELILSGENIAHGYLINGQVDQSQFLHNDEPKYFSGDIGFLTAKEGLVYVCRKDKQLKVRGYRIEPEEISSVIKREEEIDDVIITTDGKDSNSLIALCKLEHRIAPELSAAINELNKAKEKGAQVELFPMIDGTHMLGINRLETEYLYEEIIRDKTYNKHGITLNEGACVFDVGANIGFFSHYLASTFNDIKIFSFEPIGPVYDVLKANASRTGNKITAINEGLSLEPSEKVFSYYPNVTVFSGVQQGHEESVDTIKGFLKHTNENLNENDVNDLLDTRFQSIDVPVRLSMLSEHIDKYQITKIDLLKIDVERFEMNVLKGIREEHWDFIEQIIIEVHDQYDNRTNVESLLEKHGFIYTVDQNTELGGTELVNIYARKRYLPLANESFEYKVIADNEEINTVLSKILNKVSHELPEYMIPSKVGLFSDWPLTINGKVDTSRLLSLCEKGNNESIEKNPLSTDTEILLSKYISEILSIKSCIYKESNFLEIGGDSISIMKLVSSIRSEWGIELSLKEIYSDSCVSGIAKLIDTRLALSSISQDVEEDGSEMEF